MSNRNKLWEIEANIGGGGNGLRPASSRMPTAPLATKPTPAPTAASKTPVTAGPLNISSSYDPEVELQQEREAAINFAREAGFGEVSASATQLAPATLAEPLNRFGVAQRDEIKAVSIDPQTVETPKNAADKYVDSRVAVKSAEQAVQAAERAYTEFFEKNKNAWSDKHQQEADRLYGNYTSAVNAFNDTLGEYNYDYDVRSYYKDADFYNVTKTIEQLDRQLETMPAGEERDRVQAHRDALYNSRYDFATRNELSTERDMLKAKTGKDSEAQAELDAARKAYNDLVKRSGRGETILKSDMDAALERVNNAQKAIDDMNAAYDSIGASLAQRDTAEILDSIEGTKAEGIVHDFLRYEFDHNFDLSNPALVAYKDEIARAPESYFEKVVSAALTAQGYSEEQAANFVETVIRSANAADVWGVDEQTAAQWNTAERKGMMEKLDEMAGKSGWSAAALTLLSVGTNLTAGAGIIEPIETLLSDSTYTTADPNSKWLRGQQLTQGARNAVMKQYNAPVKFLGKEVDLFDEAYGILTSTADSLTAMAVGGGSKWASATVLGLSAASSTVADVTARGGTAGQALLMGIAAGAFETIFEEVSIENFQTFAQTKLRGLDGRELAKTVAGNFAKTFVVNGSEEFFTEAANVAADMILMGDISHYALSVQEYIARGATEAEARAKASNDLVRQIFSAGATGAIQGLLMGASSLANNVVTNAVAKSARMNKNVADYKLASKEHGLQVSNILNGVEYKNGSETHTTAVALRNELNGVIESGDRAAVAAFFTENEARFDQLAESMVREAETAAPANYTVQMHETITANEGNVHVLTEAEATVRTVQERVEMSSAETAATTELLTDIADGNVSALSADLRAAAKYLNSSKLKQAVREVAGVEITGSSNAELRREYTRAAEQVAERRNVATAESVNVETALAESSEAGAAFAGAQINNPATAAMPVGGEISASPVSPVQVVENAAAGAGLTADFGATAMPATGKAGKGSDVVLTISGEQFTRNEVAEMVRYLGYDNAAVESVLETIRQMNEKGGAIPAGSLGDAIRFAVAEMENRGVTLGALTEEQWISQELYRIMLEPFGVDVKVVTGADAYILGGANGMFADGVLYVNGDSADVDATSMEGIAWIIGHELTHAVKAAQGESGAIVDSIERAMRELAEAKVINGVYAEAALDSEKMDALRAQTRQRYVNFYAREVRDQAGKVLSAKAAREQAEQMVTDELIREEIAADFIGTLLGLNPTASSRGRVGSRLGRENLLVRLAEVESGKVLREAHATLGEMFKVHRRSGIQLKQVREAMQTQQRVMGELLSEFTESLKKAENATPKGDVRHSVRETTDGRFVAVVESDILSHLDTSAWNDEKKEAAKSAAADALKKFSGGIVVNGVTRKVNRVSRREYTRSNDTERLYQTSPETFADKMRAADGADDIVVAATGWQRDGKLKHPRKDNFVDFDHGRVLIAAGNAKYRATVVVGITKAGDAVFYDVVDMRPAEFDVKKEEPPTTATTQNAIGDIQGSSSSGKIPQPAENVKPHSKKLRPHRRHSAPERDAEYMKAVETGDMETAQRMVDEAAKRAGYTVKAFHGSGYPGHTAFRGHLWLAKDRRVARLFAAGSGDQGYHSKKANDREGVYEMYIRRGRNLRIDAEGCDWSNLPISEADFPGIFVDREFDPGDYGEGYGEISTDAVVEWASGRYDSVTFVNVLDGGPTTVDVIMDPARDAKSANPVTYDDNGDVIPLSERFDADNNDIRFSAPERDSKLRDLTPGQREYFKDSKALDTAGNLRVLYHGTVSDFTVFDRSYGNPENDMGVGFYFTSSRDDVVSNYATEEGPDPQTKISRLAERLEYEEDFANYDDAEEEARRRLITAEPRVIEAYVNAVNPVVLGGADETFFDYTEEYDEEYDEYGEPEGLLVEFVDALQREVWNGRYSESHIDISEIYEALIDSGGVPASELVKLVKDKVVPYIEDYYGNLANGEVVRATFERMGFDSIIDNTVATKFRNMQGLYNGTTHYIVFNSNQAKRTDNLNPTAHDDIRYSIPENVAEPASTEAGENVPAAAETAEERRNQLLREAVMRIMGYNAEGLTGATERRNADDGLGAADAGFAGETFDYQDWVEHANEQSADFHPVSSEQANNPQRERAAERVPRENKFGRLTSKHAQTLINSGVTPDAMAESLKSALANGAFSHIAFTDKRALKQARATIERLGWDAALAKYEGEVAEGKVSKENTVLGIELYNEAVTNGDFYTALDIVSRMTENATSAAQAVQAHRILNKLTPEGRLYGAIRSIANIEQELLSRYGDRAPELELDPALLEEYRDALIAGDDAAINKAWGAIEQNIADQLPSNAWEKLNAWRYLSMLGNFRTHIRNIVGNVGFMPVRLMKQAIRAGLERTALGKAGQGSERTTAVLNPASADDRALLQAAWIDFTEVEGIVLSGGKYIDTNSEIEEQRTIYKFKPLEIARKTNGNLLEVEDKVFSRLAYSEALASYLKAQGVDAGDYLNGNVTEELRNNAQAYAISEAEKATYRDLNQFSSLVSKIGKMGKRADAGVVAKTAGVIVEGVLPFKKTPANILARAVEYSPVEFGVVLASDIRKVKNGDMQVSEMLDHISSGLTGTAIVGLGCLLARFGWVVGGGDDDEKVQAFNELRGMQEYAMIIGDKNYTLDWLAPAALPFFVGVEIFNALSAKREEGEDFFPELINSLANIGEPILNMSMLSSVNDLISNVSYAAENQQLWGIMSGAVVSYLQQFLPTLFGQIERVTEFERESTFVDRNSGLSANAQYNIGKALNKLPFDFQQVPYIDAWGRHESSGNVLQRIGNNMFNPAYVGVDASTPNDEELLRLYELGYTDVLPTRPKQSTKVEGAYLTEEEYLRYATIRGQRSLELVTGLLKSGAYKDMSDEAKADAIADAYEHAKDEATNAVLEMRGLEPTADAKDYDAAVAAGMDEALYFAVQSAVSEAPIPEGYKTQPAWNKNLLIADLDLSNADKLTAMKANLTDGMAKKFDNAYSAGVAIGDIALYYAIRQREDEDGKKFSKDERKKAAFDEGIKPAAFATLEKIFSEKSK